MTRKILTIDDCRACPFSKARNFVNDGNPMTMTELICTANGNDRKKIGDYVVGIPIPIPEWCCLVDADEMMEAMASMQIEKLRKEAARG